MGTGRRVAAKRARQLLGPGSVVVRNLLKEEELGAFSGGSLGISRYTVGNVERIKLPIELGDIADGAKPIEIFGNPADVSFYLLSGENIGLRNG